MKIIRIESDSLYPYSIFTMHDKSLNIFFVRNYNNEVSCSCDHYNRYMNCEHVHIIESMDFKEISEHFCTKKVKSLFNEDFKCSICHDMISTNNLYSCTNCSYNYHIHCLQSWSHINLTCPMCRKEMNTNINLLSSHPLKSMKFNIKLKK